MKTILVPTDFSENAENALYYAIEMAKAEKAKLILLHAYHHDYSNTHIPIDFSLDVMEEERKSADQQLKALGLKIAHAGKIEYETINILNLAVDGIITTAEERKVDLIIMGTKGASGLAKFFFGSNAASVIEKANCPVIAVPEGASYRILKKITFASNFHKSDVAIMEQLIEIAEPFNAQINVLHIYEEDEATARQEMKKFIEETKHIIYSNLSYEILKGNDPEKKLKEYLQSEATDLLALSTHTRDLRDKIFGTSITKKLAYQTKVPLLAFHYRKEEHIRIT